MLYSVAPVATTSFLAIGYSTEQGRTSSVARVLWNIEYNHFRSGLWRAYQDVAQVLIGDVGQLRAVELGDDKLEV